MQKGIAPVYIVIGLLIASLALLIPIPQRSSGICLMMVGIDCPSGWSLGDPLWKIIFNSFNDSNTQKACTEEGKICPDGSGVGRVGPNCEFAECPAEKVDETADWKTYTNQDYKFSVKYSENMVYEKPNNDIYLFLVVFKDPMMVISDENFSIEVVDSKQLEDEIEYRSWQIVGHVADNIKNESRFTVGGYESAKLEWEISTSDPKGKKDSAIVIIKSNKYNYVIQASSDLIDKIVSSFQILK